MAQKDRATEEAKRHARNETDLTLQRDGHYFRAVEETEKGQS